MAKSHLTLSWIPDLKAEADFRALRIAFEVRTVRFSQIDMLESAHNGARLGDQIVRGLVEDYKTGFRNGDSFPRTAGYQGKKGIVLASGVQRDTAIKELIESGECEKDPELEMYILLTDDNMLQEISTRAANVSHGGRSSAEERMHHAMHCVSALGMATADAAKIFMVSESAIRRNIRAEEMRKELQEAGIDASGLPRDHLATLRDLDFDASIQEKVGTLIATVPTTAEKLRPVVKAVVKARNDPDRRRIVKEFERELYEDAHAKRPGRNGKEAAQRSKVPSRPRRAELFRWLTGFVHFLETGNQRKAFTNPQELQVGSVEDLKKVTDLWRRGEFRMGLILEKKK
jgi:hypothetical protein